MEVGRRWRARCFCGAARVLVGSCVPGTERGSLYGNCRAACAADSRLAVVPPPLVGAALARAAYMAQPTRLVVFIYRPLAVPRRAGAIRAGCHALRDRVGLRERICAAVDEGLPVLIDFHRCDVETSNLAGRRTHYPCCTLLVLQLSRRAATGVEAGEGLDTAPACCPGARC